MASITKKATSGYLVRWRMDGKAHSKYFPTEGEAKEYRARIEVEESLSKTVATTFRQAVELQALRKEDRRRNAPTVSEYARQTLGPELRDTTRKQYEYTIRTHIDGTPLGETPLNLVVPSAMRGYWEGLSAGIGARRNIRKTLARTFNQAVREGILKASPLFQAGIKRPSPDRRVEVRALTPAQLEKVADSAATRGDRLAILLMGYGGLRIGEVGALRVSDFRMLQPCSVRIDRAVNALGKIDQPKTRAGRRLVPIACSILEQEAAPFFAEHGLSGDDPLFKVQTQTIARAVRRAGRVAGLRVHPHQLRHTAASLWIEDGANPRQVQVALGHANVSITLGTYGHLFDQHNQALSDSMEARRATVRQGAQ